jgi:Zn-dependent protease with chaperone function
MRKATIFLLISFVFATGCAVNPVTGKSEIMFMSTAQEIEMGKQNYVPMQQSQGGVYDVDPELTAYVQRVGSKVAVQSGVDLPYEFVVLNNSVPNAWALPGGKIAINRGLLYELESEAELAAVLGHEAVHAAARHTAKQQSRAMLMQVGVMGTAIAANDSDYGNLIVGGAGMLAQLGLAKYGRGAELESDRYGMEYMSKAGYDPQGAVELQQTFVRLSEDRRQDTRPNPLTKRMTKGARRLPRRRSTKQRHLLNKRSTCSRRKRIFMPCAVTSGWYKRTTTRPQPTTHGLSSVAMTFSTITCNVVSPERNWTTWTRQSRISSAVSSFFPRLRLTSRWAILQRCAATATKQLSTTKSLPVRAENMARLQLRSW